MRQHVSIIHGRGQRWTGLRGASGDSRLREHLVVFEVPLEAEPLQASVGRLLMQVPRMGSFCRLVVRELCRTCLPQCPRVV